VSGDKRSLGHVEGKFSRVEQYWSNSREKKTYKAAFFYMKQNAEKRREACLCYFFTTF